MAQWHYSSQGTQVGPVETPELARLAQTGGLQPTDLVWKEGMAEWVPASRVKGLFASSAAPQQPVAAMAPVAAAPAYAAPQYAAPAQSLAYQPIGGSTGVTPRTVELFRQTKPWTRLVSVLLFIFCGLMLLGGLSMVVVGGAIAGPRGGGLGLGLGVFYLLAAGLYFFPALFLWRYASRIGSLITSNRSDDLEAAVEAQKSFWKFIGIAILVVICLYAVGIAILVAMRG